MSVKLIEGRIYKDEEIPEFMFLEYARIIAERGSFVLDEQAMWDLLQVVQNIQLNNKFNSERPTNGR